MSRKAAINAFCKSCIYDPHSEGTWRQQVLACTAPLCPLYRYRPLPSGENASPTAETSRKSGQTEALEVA